MATDAGRDVLNLWQGSIGEEKARYDAESGRYFFRTGKAGTNITGRDAAKGGVIYACGTVHRDDGFGYYSAGICGKQEQVRGYGDQWSPLQLYV